MIPQTLSPPLADLEGSYGQGTISSRATPLKPSAAGGFTLVEILIVMTIILVLSGLAISAVNAATVMARRTAESSAARNLITAYLAYPADNNGALMPGY